MKIQNYMNVKKIKFLFEIEYLNFWIKSLEPFIKYVVCLIMVLHWLHDGPFVVLIKS